MSSGSSVLYPVNLGNPSEFTLLELVEEIEKIVNTKLTLEFLPLPLDDPKIRKPDIQLARTALNWEPSVDLRDGLKDTYNYFLKELKK